MLDKTNSNVVVKRGNLPLIITAPHGGLKKPSHIPDRVGNGSSILGDMYTQDIAKGIEAAIKSHYKKYRPYLVLNQISRRKADVNRSLKVGTETKQGERVWVEYHNHVQECIDDILSVYNYGLLIDIHGHTHAENRVELGYLLRPAELGSNSLNEMVIQQSSIKSLAERNEEHDSPSQTMYLLGDLLTDKLISVTPSTDIPIPTNESYFSGGFTTEYYHDYKHRMDVIQIEIPKTIRFDIDNRQHFIEKLSNSIISMIDDYYMFKAKL